MILTQVLLLCLIAVYVAITSYTNKKTYCYFRQRPVKSQLLLCYRKFRKKQFILREGDVCRFETFILKGCCRTYELDEKGQEYILRFAPKIGGLGIFIVL